MTSEKTKSGILKLQGLFMEGKIKGPEQHEVHPSLILGSRENFLYFTLPCALNFQRRSPALWQSALNTYIDKETNYLFFPEKVIRVDLSKIKKDLMKHKLAIQTNKHPKIWYTLCKSFANYYDSDPRKLLSDVGFDVNKIIFTLQKDKKILFPFLSGIKLSNYWLFILAHFTDVKFKNIEEISIIPDTHVIQSSIKLGLVRSGATSQDVEKVWRAVLKELSISPIVMHSALWRWSRESFKPEL